MRKKRIIRLLPLFVVIIFFIFCFSIDTEDKRSGQSVSTPPSLDKIKSLPYFAWAPADKTSDKKSVVINDKERTYPGLNFYNSRHESQAYLIDMSGKIHHTWSYRSIQWNHIELCENGDLLVIILDKALLRLDLNSQLKWRRSMACHHDLDIADNGDIYVLSSKNEQLFDCPALIKNDYIVVLSANGEMKKEISLYDVLKKEIPYNLEIRLHKRLQKNEKSPLDLLHTNTVEIITRDVSDIFKKGNLLISSRELNLIGVIDHVTNELIWKYGPGVLTRQHHPTLLDNDNILIFDNRNKKKGSRVVELNPFLKEIVWQYPAQNDSAFFSELRGANQRLPNGNTLITESDVGRVYEVTMEGEIVWDYYNPDIKNKKRGIIYRMMRIVHREKYSFLKDLRK